MTAWRRNGKVKPDAVRRAERIPPARSAGISVGGLKRWRGLAKLDIAYQAALHLAAILIWARR